MSNLLNIKDQNGNWIPIPVITNGIQSITQNQDYTLTITLNDGTTYTTTSFKGEDGQDYILTENDKQEIAGLVNVPVTDVQINGVSAVNSGVAEIPVATVNNLGVIKIGSDYGIGKNSDNRACIQKATDTQIKNSSGTYRPITPDNQHNAIFYGLAKAAGDTTQSASSNAIGTYTDEAIVAIQKMLGIYQEPFRTIKEITITEETKLIYIDSDEDGNSFALTELIILFDSMVATNSGTGWIVINNNEAKIPSSANIAVLNAPNVYYSTARTTMSHMWLSGGRFFGEAMDNLPQFYSRSSLASCRNSMGLIECETMNNILIYSANDYKFTSGTITIIGR